MRATGNASIYPKTALFNPKSSTLALTAITNPASSLAPAKTLIQQFLPSTNLAYDASVLNTSNSASAGAVSWYGSGDALSRGKNSGRRWDPTAELYRERARAKEVKERTGGTRERMTREEREERRWRRWREELRWRRQSPAV